MKPYIVKCLALILLVVLCLSCAACQATAIVPEAPAAQETAAPYGVEDLTGCWVRRYTKSNTMATTGSKEKVYIEAFQFFSNGKYKALHLMENANLVLEMSMDCRSSGEYYTEKNGVLLLGVASESFTVVEYKRSGSNLSITYVKRGIDDNNVNNVKYTEYTAEYTLWEKTITHIHELFAG